MIIDFSHWPGPYDHLEKLKMAILIYRDLAEFEDWRERDYFLQPMRWYDYMIFKDIKTSELDQILFEYSKKYDFIGVVINNVDFTHAYRMHAEVLLSKGIPVERWPKGDDYGHEPIPWPPRA